MNTWVVVLLVVYCVVSVLFGVGVAYDAWKDANMWVVRRTPEQRVRARRLAAQYTLLIPLSPVMLLAVIARALIRLVITALPGRKRK